MTIEGIRDKIRKREYRFSDHAVRRMIKRAISRFEIEDVVMAGEIIEEYPDDNIYRVALFMEGQQKEETYMFRFHHHLQLWSLQPMSQIRKSGSTVKSGGELS